MSLLNAATEFLQIRQIMGCVLITAGSREQQSIQIYDQVKAVECS